MKDKKKYINGVKYKLYYIIYDNSLSKVPSYAICNCPTIISFVNMVICKMTIELQGGTIYTGGKPFTEYWLESYVVARKWTRYISS